MAINQWGSPVGGEREVARRRRPATEEGRGRGAPENKIKTREGPFRPFLIRGRASARDTGTCWCASSTPATSSYSGCRRYRRHQAGCSGRARFLAARRLQPAAGLASMTSGLGHARRRAHQGRGKRAAIQGEERGEGKKKEAEEGREEGGGGGGRGKSPWGEGEENRCALGPFSHQLMYASLSFVLDLCFVVPS